MTLRYLPGRLAVEIVDDGRGPSARRATAPRQSPSLRASIPTTFDLDEYVHEALRAGASGFLLKDTLPPSTCSPPCGSSPPMTP
jgi:DNA-binding NarL/FixJ family response regulator